jgi:hypothetical protein
MTFSKRKKTNNILKNVIKAQDKNRLNKQPLPELPDFFTTEPLGKDKNYPRSRGGLPGYTCERFIPFYDDNCGKVVGEDTSYCDGDYLKCVSNPYSKNPTTSFHCGKTSDGKEGDPNIPVGAICKPISGINPTLEDGNTEPAPAPEPEPAPAPEPTTVAETDSESDIANTDSESESESESDNDDTTESKQNKKNAKVFTLLTKEGPKIQIKII